MIKDREKLYGPVRGSETDSGWSVTSYRREYCYAGGEDKENIIKNYQCSMLLLLVADAALSKTNNGGKINARIKF